MPDEPEGNAPEESGTAEQQQVTMASVFEKAEAALNSSDEGTGDEQQTQGDAPDESGTVVQPDAEHIKWAKSIQGDSDEKGELIMDKVAKRSFELNKQNQDLVRRLNRLETLLDVPAMKRAALEATGRTPPQPEPQSKTQENQDEEKTDEQILEEWVNERIDQKVRPIIAENMTLHAEHMKNVINSTYAQLKEDFGTDENGQVIYDQIAPEIHKQMQAVAAQNGVSVPQLTAHLIRQNSLYSTFSNMAKNALYPKLQEKVKGLQSKTIENKTRTNLPKKGTAMQQVSKKEKIPSSIMEAYEQAEAANPQFKNIT